MDNKEFKRSGQEHQQFHADNTQIQSYDSGKQRKIYQNSQQSFNEQREQYTEQAFNDRSSYDYEQSIPEEDGSTDTEPTAYTRYHLGNGDDLTNNPVSPLVQQADTKNHNPPPEAQKPDMKKFDPTAEAPELWKKTYGITKAHEKQEKLLKKAPQKKGVRIIRTSKYEDMEEPVHDERVSLVLGRAKKTSTHKTKQRLKSATHSKQFAKGRLLFQTTTRPKTKKEYEKEEKKNNRRKYRNDILRSSAYRNGKRLISDENIAEDEDMQTLSRKTRQFLRSSRIMLRVNARNLTKNYNTYARLQFAADHERLLQMQREKLLSDSHWKAQKDAIKKSDASRKEKRRRKKQMAQERAKQEGNFFRRTSHDHKIKKKARQERQKKVKKVLSTISSVAAIIVIIFFLVMFIFLLIYVAIHSASDIFVNTTVQVDYTVMADATAYFRKLETDLEEYLSEKEELEDELKEQYGNDIFEFDYDFAEFGFNANTLIAYLGAQYGEFTLEDVQAELDSIFEEMYTLNIEIKMEEREEMKKICYVTLEKKELEEIVEARLEADKKEQYDAYKLSTGGQQVYAPVMREDWTGLISSNYGERIHPITKERRFHAGVDIAIPEGTKLYSAVEGTVTKAYYSETGGYLVEVTTDTGWRVTFMHMQGFVINVGQEIEQGDFIGYSGNTGRSTGPHLHLQVNDASGNTVNPIFIIPQTCAGATAEE